MTLAEAFPVTDAASSTTDATCPGLHPDAKWDENDALRDVLYSAERLVEHAVEVAHAHGSPSSGVTPGPLRARFSAARTKIRDVYKALAHEVRNQREASPAEEWLIDNSHVVEDQIREIQEDLPWGYLIKLPRLATGAMRGYPRVYGLCLDYLRHTDARLDLASLTSYVNAYQSVTTLTIGELWAVPIMLRMGLILIVGALASSGDSTRDRERGDAWAATLLRDAHSPEAQRARLAEFERSGHPITAALLVQFVRHLREHDAAAPLHVTSEWVHAQCARLGTTPEELVRRQLVKQAAEQVSVGNSITSMRTIGAFNWNGFFESTSVIEAELRRDPSGDYTRMENTSRDSYRHAIENIARRSPCDELTVVTAARTMAEAARNDSSDDDPRTHVGYYLIDEGRRTLEKKVGYRARLSVRLRDTVLEYPSVFYLGLLASTTAWIAWAVLRWMPESAPDGLTLVLLVLFGLVASEIAVSFLNGVVVSLLPPRLLPKFEFKKGIPSEYQTLVVVPALLDSAATVHKLLEDLEVRALGNPDKNLHFALLTDFTDAPVETTAEDADLLDLAVAGIERLNAAQGPERYFLLHRKRVQNAADGTFMGWERKRGKLDELNRLLRGAEDTTFSVVTAPRELLTRVRYVITLDADTELPRDVARRLVATMAHALNRPRLDATGRKVVRGHAIIQPRVGTVPVSSRRSRYSRILAGPPGIDPYTTAVSDVYQDLFGEGSFVGKGIYDVDAFASVMHDRVPEKTLLSHDLFEGIFAHAALATDIEVLDDQPATYEVAAGRQHRWIRGDWQLVPWLVRLGSDLRPLDRWKILDNLRRSLLGPSLIAFCVACWLAGRPMAVWGTVALAVVYLLPILSRLVLNLVRKATSPVFTGSIGGALVDNLQQSAVSLTFLLDQALVSLDAIVRTLYRLAISRKQLLEWKTMREAERQAGQGGAKPIGRLVVGAGLSLLGFVAVGVVSSESLPYAAPLLLWGMAPAIAAWLERPEANVDHRLELTTSDHDFLRLAAWKTWRFFETFVTEKEHFLPPDNFQEEPRGVVAHRTSPTNIGLYLLSVISARDFGFLTLAEVKERLDATLSTIERLERREGHVLNWYDTSTLAPLEPQYVSTVDSGNLAAYLWTLREACTALATCPFPDPRMLLATADAGRHALRSLSEKPGPGKLGSTSVAADPEAQGRQISAWIERVSAARAEIENDALSMPVVLDELSQEAGRLRDGLSSTVNAEVLYWLDAGIDVLRKATVELRTFAPFLSRVSLASPHLSRGVLAAPWAALSSALALARTPAAILGLADESRVLFDRLDVILEADATLADEVKFELTAFVKGLRHEVTGAGGATSSLLTSLSEIGGRAVALADAMNFHFLFDEERELYAIGYNVSSARLDASHYDLLASEARLASLVAIAKGDVPQKHWFRMGRPRSVAARRPVLMSWSGSMFEFLMPLLVTKNMSGTLLHETYESVVLKQIEYGAERSVPWGISESAYNVMDLGMTYQYHAFGVPGLGLKAGLADDLVIAPYATALAALVRPDLAVRNLRTLSKTGGEGKYGFYEAIDYTPSRVPPGHSFVVVKAFMAHHTGMTLIALGELLHDSPMQRRFHGDPRIKATELLLEERVPTGAPTLEPRASVVPQAPQGESEFDAVEHIGLGKKFSPRAHLLGQGELSTLVTAQGEGVITWKGLDINRFREDPVLGIGGAFVYVRRLDGKDHVWSAGYQPTRTEPDYYDAAFAIDRIDIHRRDGDIETVTQITVSPEMPVETRRVILTNHGESSCQLEVTSFTEIVLQARGGDVAHRAFGAMFVETEFLADRGVLLARRRTKSASEAETWMVQMLLVDGESQDQLEFETSRPHFLGRGRTAANPMGLETREALAGHAGAVLDPALVMRRRVSLRPAARATFTLITGLASSRDDAMRMIEKLQTPHAVARMFELAWSDARVELKHLGITATQSHRFQRLLSLVLFPRAVLRVTTWPAVRGRGRSALWTHGISGDLPILLVRIDDPDFAELLREILHAHEFWRLNGVSIDVVLLNEEAPGYLQPVQEAILSQVRSSPSNVHLDQRGGIFVRRSREMSDDDRATLLCTARLVLASSEGSLSRQLRRASNETPVTPAPFVPSRAPLALPVSSGEAASRPKLQFDNGLGGFSEDGRDYVMVLAPGAQTPAPWSNVMANPLFGTLVTERGSSFTWNVNSQKHRLTPWSNDAVCDPSGEAIYLRDDEDGSIWSATPDPAGNGATYTVRHGQGYSTFEHTRGTLVQSLTHLVSAKDPVKLFRLHVENKGTKARRLSLFGVVEWVIGNNRETGRLSLVSQWVDSLHTLLVNNPLGLFPAKYAFFTATQPARSATADREEFFGAMGSRSYPEALRRVGLSGRVGAGLDPCAALHVTLVVEPGQSVDVSFVLGEGEDLESTKALAQKYGSESAAKESHDEVVAFWDDVLGTITVKTPDPALDVLVNRWLLYQVLSCRFWGRSGFYQSGGAYGFRDQLQDVLALLHSRPALARAHIVAAAARQFVQGDVQHWWHPESGEGVRTRCSDDLLFLPFATVEYVHVTGDSSILDEVIPFLQERELRPDEEDLFGAPAISEGKASLYEHCVRALENGATSGAHGMPTMRGGDWNDGMNRVGAHGTGESVWLAWFLAKTAKDFRSIAVARQDSARATWCESLVHRLSVAIDEHAWDGAWYRRAYFDDGTPLGSSSSAECKIDAIAQSWAVISGVGNPERARQALHEAENHLVREDAGLMALLSPPFDHAGPDPGYIAAYPPGIRENGGQYTHGVLWTVQALALAGEGKRAGELLSLLNPVHHGSTPAQVDLYKVEPYVICADVYTAKGHVGRGGWTWYTGSASWMYRISVETILGLHLSGATLSIDPCIPPEWKEFELTYFTDAMEIHIRVDNPRGVERGVTSVTMDGQLQSGASVSLALPSSPMSTPASRKRVEMKVVLG